MTRSGILLIDKPEGPSSAQVAHRVKRFLHVKRLGHLGTLDPFASGLLPLGINEGTKIADLFLSGTKSYCGVMSLGVETDTQDRTGQVIRVRPVPPLTGRDLVAAERQFTGHLQQVPPMFSALKKNGVRLYRLARQGKEVPREPREVRIEGLRLRQLSTAEVEFEVTCSRGTYVRTLATDIGAALGCGAHLKNLRRLACDHLSVDRAITLEQLERTTGEEEVPLISLAAALAHLRGVTWESRDLARLRLGQQQILSRIDPPFGSERLVRIQDRRGQLAALAEWKDGFPGGRWQLLRVFHSSVEEGARPD